MVATWQPAFFAAAPIVRAAVIDPLNLKLLETLNWLPFANRQEESVMNGRGILGIGVLGALGCIGACAAAAFVPALLAGSGVGLIADGFATWQVAGGLALVAAAVVWLLSRRKRSADSCACGAKETP